VDDQLGLLRGGQDDRLEEVAGAVRPDDQPAVRLVASVFDSEGMVDGVHDVFVGDSVLSRRAVDLHRD
jgi:hypothetical protein